MRADGSWVMRIENHRAAVGVHYDNCEGVGGILNDKGDMGGLKGHT